MLMGWGRLIRRGCLVSMLALAAAGCNSNSEPPTPGNATPSPMEAAMAFAPAGAQASSRDGNTYLEEAGIEDFAVVCSKTDSQRNTQYVMSRDDKGNSPYIVRYDAGHSWHYGDIDDQFLKYWDFSAQDYTFYALAGYDAVKTAYPETTFSNGFVNIKGVKGHLAPADAIPPLLECHYRRVASPIADYDLLSGSNKAFYTPGAQGATPAMGDIVPLVFHRAMTEVQFLIYDSEGKEVKLNHVKIEVPADEEMYGIYTEAEYKALEFVEYDSDKMLKKICDKDIEIYTGTKTEPALLFEAIELPQMLRQSVDITIDAENGTFFGSISLGNTANNFSWQKSKIYKYILIVDSGSDLILVDVMIDDWEVEDSTENTQTNW